jgi:hypothetical protein
MEVIFVRHHTAVIDFDVDQVGVDAVNGSTESPEVHSAIVDGVYQKAGNIGL